MYDELVKRLRCQLYGNCPACVNWYVEELEPNLWRERCAAIDAADAIEELIAKLNHADDQIDRLVEAAEERRWIPVAERLPEKTGKYLVCGKWRGRPMQIWICEFMTLDCLKGWSNNASNPLVSHWMPLPEPPTAEEGET